MRNVWPKLEKKVRRNPDITIRIPSAGFSLNTMALIIEKTMERGNSAEHLKEKEKR
ncbi:MAG: hypothetical protein RBT69_07730 [Spirochaetia bacterium]|jgi:hypothetical protein|nr:hypothetical protein [Spirochaetia bacterium]